MPDIIPKLRGNQKRKLKKLAKTSLDARFRIRCLIVLNLNSGKGGTEVAETLHIARKTVYRVAGRYRASRVAGLVDRREENGETKLSDGYLGQLYELVKSSPHQFKWPRPTWTREMLIKTMKQKTGVLVSPGTMSRALKMINARRGRPKPTVGCPWSSSAKNKRLKAISQLVENLPKDEVVVYQDEVDIHLNPKIGPDWMVQGQQKEVMTPGKNEKRYLAGALNPHTGALTWVEGEKKNSVLFIQLLWQLHLAYPDAKRIHVILDNYSIHSTQQVKQSLDTENGSRFQLHFLPPYCPDHNRIERLWQDLHANVTRNHTCSDMKSLMKKVRAYLRKRNKAQATNLTLAA